MIGLLITVIVVCMVIGLLLWAKYDNGVCRICKHEEDSNDGPN